MTAVPLLDLKPQYRALSKSINERIQNVLNHGQFILGPEVAECEKDLGAYIGARCLTAASGTDALMMALMALDIGVGDEVITTPFSFFATAETISLVGASPVFVDIDPVTFNIDPSKIESAITKKTKAIMPVSLYGQPADFDVICKIAEKHGLPVIEDAAQSFGARYKDRKSCNLSLVSATSFFPAKPLGCYGDGGAVFTNDEALFKKMEQIRVHGQAGRYYHVMLGINGRLDTLQCAILIEKLKRYDWEIERRNEIASAYTKAFSKLGVDKCKVPEVLADRGSVWAQYTLRVANRDQFAIDMKKEGVPTSVHYPSPLHHQPVYAHIKDRFTCPEAEKAAATCISLPMFPDMETSQVEVVCEAVRKCLR